MTTPRARQFTKGRKYRVYLRGQRSMVATYLGKSYGTDLQFDLRPVGGTQTLQPDDILHSEPVPQSLSHSLTAEGGN